MKKWFKNWLRSLVFDKYECGRLYLKLVTATSTSLGAPEEALQLYRLLYRPRTISRLKQMTGLDRRTLRKVLRDLERHELIQRKEAGGTTFYTWR